jgi:hypothetical protein
MVVVQAGQQAAAPRIDCRYVWPGLQLTYRCDLVICDAYIGEAMTRNLGVPD